MKKSNSIANNNSNNDTVYIQHSTHKNKLMSVNSSGKKAYKTNEEAVTLSQFCCPSCCEVVSEFYTEWQSTLLWCISIGQARPCHANASVNVWNIYIAIHCRLLPLFLLYGSLTLNWPQDYIRISFLIPFSLVWFGLIFDSSCPPLPLIHTHARFALSLSFIFLPSHLVRALPCALSIKNTRKNFPYFSYRTKFASNFSFSLHHFEHLYECNASKARGINFQ